MGYVQCGQLWEQLEYITSMQMSRVIDKRYRELNVICIYNNNNTEKVAGVCNMHYRRWSSFKPKNGKRLQKSIQIQIQQKHAIWMDNLAAKRIPELEVKRIFFRFFRFWKSMEFLTKQKEKAVDGGKYINDNIECPHWSLLISFCKNYIHFRKNIFRNKHLYCNEELNDLKVLFRFFTVFI